MEKLIKEYILMLEEDKPASEKFWELDDRIKHDSSGHGVLMQLRRSEMILVLVGLINDGVIGYNDLIGFSDEVKNNIKLLIR